MKEDLINRQAAIDVAFDIFPDDEYFREQFVKGIEALPSVQSVAKGINVLSNDLISRQEAIDQLHQSYNLLDAERRLEDLPSVQPEPCEDAVSRQTLKNGFKEMCDLDCPYTKKQQHVMCGSCGLGTAFDVLEATPSVTPKQRKNGKWYDVGSLSCRCSECGCKSPKEYSYCPNCGAQMREGDR